MNRWKELRREAERAAAELAGMRDGMNLHSPEWDRLNGKVQGVELVLSYMDDLERLERVR